MARKDLTHVTFIIPVRIDCKERHENLTLVLNYLQHHFDTNIIVCEESPKPVLAHLAKRVQYMHQVSEEKNFHRTRCLNLMIKASKTPVIANYDADVLMPVKQYIRGTTVIRNGEIGLILPYSGPVHDVGRAHISKIAETKSVKFLKNEKLVVLNPRAVGGVLFFRAERYRDIGLENEHFRYWGHEDNERITRYVKFGFHHRRTRGPLYHLNHPRGINSHGGHPENKQNEKEFLKVHNMTSDKLKEYVKSWPWTHD